MRGIDEVCASCGREIIRISNHLRTKQPFRLDCNQIDALDFFFVDWSFFMSCFRDFQTRTLIFVRKNEKLCIWICTPDFNTGACTLREGARLKKCLFYLLLHSQLHFCLVFKPFQNLCCKYAPKFCFTHGISFAMNSRFFLENTSEYTILIHTIQTHVQLVHNHWEQTRHDISGGYLTCIFIYSPADSSSPITPKFPWARLAPIHRKSWN